MPQTAIAPGHQTLVDRGVNAVLALIATRAQRVPLMRVVPIFKIRAVKELTSMLIRTIAALLSLLAVLPFSQAADQLPGRISGQKITVYKSPTCGCCAAWAEYLEHNGFDVSVVNQNDLSQIKKRFGVEAPLQSCHTAIVDGYVIEGHVPANDIWRLLAEKPQATGLTAPGMPMMSPGMHSIEPKGYDILLFDKGTKTSVYSSY